MQNTPEPYEPPIQKMIDFRIPLPWLIGGFVSIAFTLVSMYFSVNQLVRDMGELQITVKAGNSQSITLAGEQALLRFRLENLEGEIRTLKSGTQTAPQKVH